MVGPASLHFMVWGGQNGKYNSDNRYETHHQTPQKKFMPIALIGLQYSVLTPDVQEEFWSKISSFETVLIYIYLWRISEELLAVAFCTFNGPAHGPSEYSHYINLILQ